MGDGDGAGDGKRVYASRFFDVRLEVVNLRRCGKRTQSQTHIRAHLHKHTHTHPHIAWHTSGSGTLLIIEFSSICSPCCCSYCCCSSHSQPQIAFFARWLIFELFFFCRLDLGTLKHTQAERERGRVRQNWKSGSRVKQTVELLIKIAAVTAFPSFLPLVSRTFIHNYLFISIMSGHPKRANCVKNAIGQRKSKRIHRNIRWAPADGIQTNLKPCCQLAFVDHTLIHTLGGV